MSTVSSSVRWSLCAAHTAAIAVLSLAPMDAFPQTGLAVPFADKAVHFALYGVYATLLVWALPWRGRRAARLAGIALFCAAYGLAMEGLQGAMHRHLARSFYMADAAANAAGAAAAALLGLVNLRRRPAHGNGGRHG